MTTERANKNEKKVVLGINARSKSFAKRRLAKKQKYLKNRAYRADMNRSSSSNSSGFQWNNASAFHTSIRALQLGTAT